MGLETATYVNDLVATNPVAGDNVSQGDDHLRLLKTALKTTFPNSTKPFYFPDVVTKTADYVVLSTDEGKIVVCDGTSAAVGLTLPTLTTAHKGWAICVHAANVANAVTVTPPSGTISGEASLSLTKQYATLWVRWTGTAFILDQDDLTRKLRTVTAARVLGRGSASSGEAQELTLSGLTLSGTVLTADILPPLPPQGYLTISATNGESFIAGDVAGATSLYYDFAEGDLIPIPDGTNFTMRRFTRLTLVLDASVQAAGGIYDVWAFDDSGTLRIGTGPAWTTLTAGSGARGTGGTTTELSRVHGVRVNANAITVTYGTTPVSKAAGTCLWLGTIYTSTAGALTCHVTAGQARKWEIFNGHNRKRIALKLTDSTANSWDYAESTVRQSHADANNKVTVVRGVQEELVEVQFRQNGVCSTGSSSSTTTKIGIGVNSTTVMSGFAGVIASENPVPAAATATHVMPRGIGIDNINALELGQAGITPTFYGGEDDMQMLVCFNG